MTNEDSIGSNPVKPPQIPPRTSSLPPPIPNKSPAKKRTGSLAYRNIKIPDHKPLEKILPLQIHPPSMLKTIQRKNSTENFYIQQTAGRI